MAKIHLLPEHLVNQIAAGEVVERPASVLKELCENSLDAGATAIKVELLEGGLRKLVVADDGCGMSPEDARSCLERHATSKLTDAEGLKRIATMGFRGEAVPAIASVSRFTLTTREQTSDAATRIVINGGRVDSSDEVGAPAGTTIVVEDLFFNTPARRKFMKRPETEAGHASEALIRLMLARPDVGFTLVSGGRQSLSSPAAPKDPRERIAAALGTEVFEHLVPLNQTINGLAITGHVASPDFSLSNSRGIYTFINQRFVRDRGLIAAVQRAFADMLPPGRQPAAVLFLAIPFEEVDVNVHPQKLEVRFADSRRVFEAVYGAIQTALRKSPWLASRPKESDLRTGESSPAYPQRPTAPTPFSFSFKPGPMPAPTDGQARPSDGMALYQPLPEGEAPQPPATAQNQGYFHSLRVVGQFARTYLVCEAPGPSLVVVDQHAAHERLKFHQLREAFRARKPQVQAFLFPASVELPLAQARVLADHLDEVKSMGFELEPFGGTSFALQAVPAPLVGCDYKALLGDLASELMQVERGRAFDQAMDDVLATMACHAAVRAHQTLSPEEARALLDALDGIDFSTRCPHGRPVAAEIPLAQLEREVQRR